MHSPHYDNLPLDVQNLVSHAMARLEREFDGIFGPETVEKFIIDSLDQLAPKATVTTFLPLTETRPNPRSSAGSTARSRSQKATGYVKTLRTGSRRECISFPV